MSDFRPTIEDHRDGGFLLSCLGVLKAALVDNRLHRSHRLILVSLVERSNSKTCTAWPSRMTIAADTDLEPKTVSNKLSELIAWGYVKTERAPIEEGARVLTQYTFPTRYDVDEMRKQIAIYCDSIRSGSSPRAGKSEAQKFPAGGEVPCGRGTKVPRGRGTEAMEFPAGGEVPCGRGTKVPRGRGTEAMEFPAGGAKSSPPAGHGNLYKGTRSEEGDFVAPQAMAKTAPTDLFGGRGPTVGVVYPTALLDAINRGRAKETAEVLIEAVNAEITAKAPPELIARALRDAVAAAFAADEGKTPSDYALLRKATTFVNNARRLDAKARACDALDVAKRKSGRPDVPTGKVEPLQPVEWEP